MDARYQQVQASAEAQYYRENPDGYFYPERQDRFEFSVRWRTAVAPLHNWAVGKNVEQLDCGPRIRSAAREALISSKSGFPHHEKSTKSRFNQRLLRIR